MSDNHFLTVESKDITDKLSFIERKLEDSQSQVKKSQVSLESLENEKVSKEQELSRKKDALFSSNAEL